MTHSVQREIKEKERAIEILSKRYGKRPPRNDKLPSTVMGEEEVRQVLYAVGDNHGTTVPFVPLQSFPIPLPANPPLSIILLLPHPKPEISSLSQPLSCLNILLDEGRPTQPSVKIDSSVPEDEL
jgi:hypothetical protein